MSHQMLRPFIVYKSVRIRVLSTTMCIRHDTSEKVFGAM